MSDVRKKPILVYQKASKQKQNELKIDDNIFLSTSFIICRQNAEKDTYIKGRLPYQAVILFNCFSLQHGNFYKRKEFAPIRSKCFTLRAYFMENHFYNIRWPPLIVTLFITLVRNGSYANQLPSLSVDIVQQVGQSVAHQ